jgi:hypothetical protein
MWHGRFYSVIRTVVRSVAGGFIHRHWNDGGACLKNCVVFDIAASRCYAMLAALFPFTER